jgi:hypothetical protein
MERLKEFKILMKSILLSDEKFEINLKLIHDEFFQEDQTTPLNVSSSVVETMKEKYKNKEMETFDQIEKELMKQLNGPEPMRTKKKIILPTERILPKNKSPIASPIVQRLKNIKKKKENEIENDSNGSGESSGDLSSAEINEELTSQSLTEEPTIVKLNSPEVETSSSTTIAGSLPQMLQLNLKSSGSGPNSGNTSLNSSPRILSAVKEGDVETVSSILEEQDLKSKYYKDEVTLLHLAVSNPTEAVTELLIERGADVDAIDKHMRTPLHLAASIGSSNSLVLIANGAKTNVRDNYGFSPLMLSLKQHYFSLSSQFILFGADINFKRE